jgi:hypothetical protein
LGKKRWLLWVHVSKSIDIRQGAGTSSGQEQIPRHLLVSFTVTSLPTVFKLSTHLDPRPTDEGQGIEVSKTAKTVDRDASASLAETFIGECRPAYCELLSRSLTYVKNNRDAAVTATTAMCRSN